MKTNKNIIIIAIALLFVGCAIKPTLMPVNIFQVDIGKDGKMYFELIDSHKSVVIKNRTNLPGLHHDVDEDNYLPVPFVKYLEENILIIFDVLNTFNNIFANWIMAQFFFSHFFPSYILIKLKKISYL